MSNFNVDEIIKLCNDFKEIGVFYLFINPNDESYGNQTPREFGLAILQDQNGLYQFESSLSGDFLQQESFVNRAYQKSLDIADLSIEYLDKNEKNKEDPNFIPPTPIFDNPPKTFALLAGKVLP